MKDYERLQRLVELGDLDAASRLLTEAKRRGEPLHELQALLLSTPSTELWTQVTTHLASLSGPELDTALALAEALLRAGGWPNHLCLLDSEWAHELASGHPERVPQTRLARRADCSHRLFPIDTLLELVFPAVPELRELDLSFSELTDRDALDLAELPQLEHIERLDLSVNRLTAEGLGPLFEAPRLRNLRSLRLDGNDLGEAGARILANASFEHLEILTLSDCSLVDASLVEFENHASLPNLETLELSHNEELTPAAAAALANLKLPSLKELSLDACPLGDAGIERLARAPTLAALSTLNLRHVRLGPSGAQALARAAWTGLKHLHLGGNSLGDEGIAAWTREAGTPQLETLALEACELTDAGFSHLLNAPCMKHLRVLHLQNNRIRRDGLRALTHPHHLSELRHLDLSLNPLDHRGLTDLLRARTLPHLHTLALNWCGLGNPGARIVAEDLNPASQVRVIRLHHNRIGNRGARALAGSERLEQLERLELAGNPISGRGLRALQRSRHLEQCELQLPG